MNSSILTLILHLLVARYPTADSCYDVLDLEMVENEESSRAQMEWCIQRHDRHYRRKEGNTFRGFTCHDAIAILSQPDVAQETAKRIHSDLESVRLTAQYILDQWYCNKTRADELRDFFETEKARQIARFDCWNAEDEENYGPDWMGKTRNPKVDFECSWGGWKRFYVKPDGTED